MLYFFNRFRVKPFEDSSCASSFVGAKDFILFSNNASAAPSAMGLSGPMMAKSTFCDAQKFAIASMSVSLPISYTSESFAIPGFFALPKVTREGECFDFFNDFAIACSRAPFPTRRIFMCRSVGL